MPSVQSLFGLQGLFRKWNFWSEGNCVELENKLAPDVLLGSSCMMLYVKPSQYKYGLSRSEIYIIKLRRPWDRLILTMGIPILVRRHLHIETFQGVKAFIHGVNTHNIYSIMQGYTYMHTCISRTGKTGTSKELISRLKFSMIWEYCCYSCIPLTFE